MERFHSGQSGGQRLWKFIWTKEIRFQRKRVQLPRDLFGKPTWPPFHSFGTPIWPPWRHVKTLCKRNSNGLLSALKNMQLRAKNNKQIKSLRASQIPRITGDFKMNVIKHINRGEISTLTIIILGYKVKFYTNENYTNYLSLHKLDLASRRRIHKNLLCTFHVFLSNLYNYLGKNTICFVKTKKTKISMGISVPLHC